MAQKKILILDAQTDEDSLVSALAKSYCQGALDGGHSVNYTHLADLQIDWILQKKYFEGKNWELDLKKQQTLVKWCEHLVVFTPNLWWNMPALLKAYFDRIFTDGFASDYKESPPYVIPLLKGRSARVIYTQNAPLMVGWLFKDDLFWLNISKAVLEHCGFHPVERNVFSKVKDSNEEERKKWLALVYEMGKKGE